METRGDPILTSVVFERIKSILQESKTSYEILEHAAVYTSNEAAKIRDTDMSIGAKALVCLADKEPVLLVVPGDRKVDFKKFKHSFGVKDLRMATPEEVEQLTGLKIGAIPPVGKAMGIKSYFDESINHKDKVAFNAGAHTISIEMNAKDLIKIENPILTSLV